MTTESIFHLNDGVYFKKDTNKDFISMYKKIGENVEWEYIITTSELASVVAHCSKSGETSEKYCAALDFLKS